MELWVNPDGTADQAFRPYFAFESTTKTTNLYDPNNLRVTYGMYDDHYFPVECKTPYCPLIKQCPRWQTQIPTSGILPKVTKKSEYSSEVGVYKRMSNL
jgi:hypothetical protein